MVESVNIRGTIDDNVEIETLLHCGGEWEVGDRELEKWIVVWEFINSVLSLDNEYLLNCTKCMYNIF